MEPYTGRMEDGSGPIKVFRVSWRSRCGLATSETGEGTSEQMSELAEKLEGRREKIPAPRSPGSLYVQYAGMGGF